MDKELKEKAKMLSETLKSEARDELDLNFLLIESNRVLQRKLRLDYGSVCAGISYRKSC